MASCLRAPMGASEQFERRCLDGSRYAYVDPHVRVHRERLLAELVARGDAHDVTLIRPHEAFAFERSLFARSVRPSLGERIEPASHCCLAAQRTSHLKTVR